ncbi:MAG: XTP/dITP diphosphatase [Methanosarcinales archaeon]|nr:MAG: XTP/dITP diphosphatase [Methanosarcinales archaeon]
MTDQIMFVTGNLHKVAEAAAICAPRGIVIVQNDCGYPELQDDDVARVAEYGAEHVVSRLGCAVIVEDTGLYIDALNGFPGPYAAYVYDTIGNAGILALMRDIDGGDNRRATFRSVIGYCEPGVAATTFEGIATGTIAHEERGEGGFGYDPIFEIDGVAFSLMGDDAKNNVSHRAKSFEKFAEWFIRRGMA